MPVEVLYHKTYAVKGGDFDKAGEVSTQIKGILKATGIQHDIIRRAAIASFEAEMNVVIHAESGEIDFVLTPTDIEITVSDKGPGIEDIPRAMQEGYSTASDAMRARGFGAGMGLPNIKKSVDDFEIETEVGVGTRLKLKIKHKLQ
jgi:serine/threonine-protein kinase RsbT